jgi:hypothetical protein
MTPINSYFEASQKTRSLDGIPEAFLQWAVSSHGWTREDLLTLGRTRYAGDAAEHNALDHFVSNFKFSADHGKCVYCNAGMHGLRSNPLGHLECDECSSREYRKRTWSLQLIEAEYIAAGCPDALQLDVRPSGFCPWTSLLQRLETARQRLSTWTERRDDTPPTSQTGLFGPAPVYPD